ncbi:MAG: transposase [Syntrophales bacterium]
MTRETKTTRVSRATTRVIFFIQFKFHSYWNRLQYHLVWMPKYRRRVLRGKMVIRLREAAI